MMERMFAVAIRDVIVDGPLRRGQLETRPRLLRDLRQFTRLKTAGEQVVSRSEDHADSAEPCSASSPSRGQSRVSPCHADATEDAATFAQLKAAVKRVCAMRVFGPIIPAEPPFVGQLSRSCRNAETYWTQLVGHQ